MDKERKTAHDSNHKTCCVKQGGGGGIMMQRRIRRSVELSGIQRIHIVDLILFCLNRTKHGEISSSSDGMKNSRGAPVRVCCHFRSVVISFRRA